jgi:hypothetical protein
MPLPPDRCHELASVLPDGRLFIGRHPRKRWERDPLRCEAILNALATEIAAVDRECSYDQQHDGDDDA